MRWPRLLRAAARGECGAKVVAHAPNASVDIVNVDTRPNFVEGSVGRSRALARACRPVSARLVRSSIGRVGDEAVAVVLRELQVVTVRRILAIRADAGLRADASIADEDTRQRDLRRSRIVALDNGVRERRHVDAGIALSRDPEGVACILRVERIELHNGGVVVSRLACVVVSAARCRIRVGEPYTRRRLDVERVSEKVDLTESVGGGSARAHHGRAARATGAAIATESSAHRIVVGLQRRATGRSPQRTALLESPLEATAAWSAAATRRSHGTHVAVHGKVRTLRHRDHGACLRTHLNQIASGVLAVASACDLKNK